jgi:hypothetical protein
MSKYLYPLVMVFVAIAGAAAIVGYAVCEQRGGCTVTTGDATSALVKSAVLYGIGVGGDVGYAAGRAATCGKDDI